MPGVQGETHPFPRGDPGRARVARRAAARPQKERAALARDLLRRRRVRPAGRGQGSMQVRHNGRARRIEAGAGASLAQVFQTCVGDGPRVVITRARLDGRDLSRDEIDALGSRPAAGHRELEVETRPAAEVALESLESSAAYVPALEAALQHTAAQLRQGRIEEANELFAGALDGFSVLLFAVSAAARELPEAASSLAGFDDELQPWLESLCDAQKGHDWLSVADALEYEVAPRVSQWAVRIREAQGRLRGSP